MSISRRGFASMDEVERRAVARRGGKAVAPEHRSFSKDRALASAAGRKGAQARDANRKERARLAALGSGSSQKK